MPDEQERAVEYTPNINENLSTTALHLRLDNSEVINGMRLHLSGSYINEIVDPKTNKLKKQIIKIGEPRLNYIGLQSIMGVVRAIVNAPTIQGNIKEERYRHFLARNRIYIAEIIGRNRALWDIKETEQDLIINDLMNTIELVTSRSIDNLERLSYGMKVVDTSRIQSGKWHMPFFNNNRENG